ncbi:mannonate dehydratase [Candidatus Latescibacterota bacterium]
MKRRDFGKSLTAGSVGAVAASCANTDAVDTAQPKKEVLMHVGDQNGGTSQESLEFKARNGVFHIDGAAPRVIDGVGWDLEDSLKKKEDCEKYGISLEAYHLPLSSAGIDNVRYPNIMLGKSPERDREIEIIQQMIEVAAKTGVRLLNYNTTIHPVLRTGRTPDPKRGNASYSTWNYEEAMKQDQSLTIAGVVTVDDMFERITYLLDRILPVAEEWKVQLGNHIADPPTPLGYRGIDRWVSPDVFAAIKRFCQLYDSPYHGINLCIGSAAEGLKDPNTEIHPIITWLGERKQLFNIHFRNIIGGWNNFMEVYPDNGDMNFYEVARTLRDVGYPYMLMPDHTPRGGQRGEAMAFAFGFIKGLVLSLKSEA